MSLSTSSGNFNVMDIDLNFESNPVFRRRDLNLSYCEFVALEEGVCVLGLKHPSILYFKGILEVYCLQGQIEVLGHVISCGESEEVFSLMGSSATSLTTTVNESVFSSQSPKASYLKNSMHKAVLEKMCENIDGDGAVIILTSRIKRYDHWHQLLKANKLKLFVNYHLFPRRSLFSALEEALDCVFDHKSGSRIVRKIVADKSWDEYIRPLGLIGFRLMICGGKGFGKSTLFRYLVNRSLLTYPKVVTIDLDPGQTEFNLSRTLSCHIVDKPLLGPNFANFRQSRWCVYLGTASPGDRLLDYISGVEALFALCEADNTVMELPWIINTMGFTKGVGLLMNCAAVRVIRPTRILVLNSEDRLLKSRNFTEPLVGNTMANRVLDSIGVPKVPFKPEIINIQTPVDSLAQTPKMHANVMNPKDLRLAADVIYFAESQEITVMLGIEGEFQGDIMPLFSEESSRNFRNCVGFGKLVSFDRSNGELCIKVPKYLIDVFERERIFVNPILMEPLRVTYRIKRRRIEPVEGVNQYTCWRRSVRLRDPKSRAAYKTSTINL